MDYTMPTDPYTTPFDPSTLIYLTGSMSTMVDSGSSGVEIRESLTTAPSGQVTTTQNTTDGTFVINSFFDIFTEISLDGGTTNWTAATGPLEVSGSSVPEPTALIVWSLLGSLGIALGWWRRRKAA